MHPQFILINHLTKNVIHCICLSSIKMQPLSFIFHIIRKKCILYDSLYFLSLKIYLYQLRTCQIYRIWQHNQITTPTYQQPTLPRRYLIELLQFVQTHFQKALRIIKYINNTFVNINIKLVN